MNRLIKSVVAVGWFLLTNATWSMMFGMDFGPEAMIAAAPFVFAVAWWSTDMLCKLYWKQSFRSFINFKDLKNAKN